ncbi:CrcB family protein [Corynebacterium mendelii]|uniref:Fluoride-specific ion channel n=1 Tax=Corynebacterium mendelii TaxID=2765362 RepID=A0A939E155_9CORY|nr:CrcB family protein [Corynebacterium mendelii]MBN9644535.1 CrcB family protein [Corynebacterium mendelii]
MTPPFIIAAVVAGAFAGGQLRWWLRQLLPLLWGTWTANILACIVMGLAVRFDLDDIGAAVVAAGFAGALSTWSTLAKEIGELITTDRITALVYTASTLVCGFVAFGAAAFI